MTANYESVRQHAGWLDLKGWGLIRVTGSDRSRFLQGQTTNDLNQAHPGKCLPTAFCSPTGHLLTDALILNAGAEWLILLPELTFGETLSRLHNLIILDEVELEPLNESIGVLSLQGPRSQDVLEEIEMENTPSEPEQHRIALWNGAEIRVVERDRSGSGGYDLYAPFAVMEEFKTALITAGALEIEPALWDVLRYEAGIPLYGVDMNERILAPEMGKSFESSHVSYTKGCYTGQEVIMRIHSRGHTNRSWTPLLMESGALPLRETPIEAPGKPDAGWVTGAIYSPALNGVLVWGFVRNAFIQAGTGLTIGGAKAKVIDRTPFAPSN